MLCAFFDNILHISDLLLKQYPLNIRSVRTRFYKTTFKMITFETGRKKLAMMGVVLYHPEQKYQFISQKITIFFLMISSFVSLIFYIAFEADNLQDYMNTIFLLSIQIISSLTASNCIWNTVEIYRILNNFENIVDTSMELNHKMSLYYVMVCQSRIIIIVGMKMTNIVAKAIYNEAEKKLLIWDKILDIGAVKAMPICAILPLSIFSIFKYFTTDLGEKAFVLPVETW